MRGWIQLGAIVGAIAGCTSFAQADHVLPSNLGILETLTEQAVNEVVSSLTPPRSETITLMASTPHEGNQFVLGRLAIALAEAGFEVTVARTAVAAPPGEEEEETAKPGGGATRAAVNANKAAADGETEVAPDSSPESLGSFFDSGAYPAGTILDVDILQFGVHYAEAKRKMWVGGVEFTRIAGIYLRVSQLEGPSGRWVALAKAEKHHWDRVSGRQRVLAEGASYPFAPPALHAPGLGTYVEPALVVGVVGSLIYLFYANQN